MPPEKNRDDVREFSESHRREDRERERQTREEKDAEPLDPVQEGSEESFPASDPPSTMPGSA